MEKKTTPGNRKIDGNELLNSSTSDLATYYATKFSLSVPVLYADDITVNQKEVQIDVSNDKGRYFSHNSGPYYIAGTCIEVEVPFSGDAIGFKIQPTTQNYNNPRASIGDSTLHFSISGVNLTSEYVKSGIEKKIASINEHLQWLERDAKDYNKGLINIATQAIEQRKQKLLKDQNLVAGLGFKMKARSSSSETYSAPKVRRTIKTEIPKPVGSRQPFKPEPTLLTADYEHILSVLENMVRVMEQSPGAFQKIDEESLRTHFLVQLNGHFMGDATGETFNFEGKTDILIKVDGKNIFIGECKFWTGEKGYLETIDQVLSYLSWRDTKAAILVFNRNKDFSGVVEKIFEFTKKHTRFKNLIKQYSETSCSYLFAHKDDSNREVVITVQAYNVPERVGPRLRTTD